MTQMTVLQPGDPFPSLTVALPGGRALRLPDALAGRFGVVLYYRGSWCPYCNALWGARTVPVAVTWAFRRLARIR